MFQIKWITLKNKKSINSLQNWDRDGVTMFYFKLINYWNEQRFITLEYIFLLLSYL